MPACKNHLPTLSSILQSDAPLMGLSAVSPTQADEALLHAWHFGGDYTYDSDLSKAEEVWPQRMGPALRSLLLHRQCLKRSVQHT